MAWNASWASCRRPECRRRPSTPFGPCRSISSAKAASDDPDQTGPGTGLEDGDPNNDPASPQPIERVDLSGKSRIVLEVAMILNLPRVSVP